LTEQATLTRLRNLKKKMKADLRSAAEMELPFSYGLLRKYELIPERTNAITVMRVMQRVAKHPSVAKKREYLPIETIVRLMSARKLAELRSAVLR
jgi:hypothetical protein